MEGAFDALTCDVVSQSSEVWNPQMLWQTLNYTIVPAASIALLASTSVSPKVSKGAQTRKGQ